MTGYYYNRSKYGAKRTWSELCQRRFDSRAEAKRGEELFLLQKAGAISELEFQKEYRLCDKPKISVKIDFYYKETSSKRYVHEDVKGMGETREFRIKRAWLQEKYGIIVYLTGK